jgi:hypothetical protein
MDPRRRVNYVRKIHASVRRYREQEEQEDEGSDEGRLTEVVRRTG